MHKLHRSIKLLIIVLLPAILIEITVTVLFAHYNGKSLTTCHCADKMTVCMVDNVNYTYPRCVSNILFNSIEKKLEYVVIADTKYYVMINIGTILVFLVMVLCVPVSKLFIYYVCGEEYAELDSELDVLNV